MTDTRCVKTNFEREITPWSFSTTPSISPPKDEEKIIFQGPLTNSISLQFSTKKNTISNKKFITCKILFGPLEK
jgi:hypothetical protein